jgi:hypothetical protein
MNVEQNIHFLLAQQAQTSGLLAETAAWVAETTARVADNAVQISALAARQEKTDRQMATVLKLLKAGMKMLAAHDRRFDVVDGKLDQILDPNRRRS